MRYQVWGFENSRVAVCAEFKTFDDAMKFASALQNAVGIEYIEVESRQENEKRTWELGIDGWKFKSTEKIED